MTRAQRIQTNIDAISTPIDVEQIKSRLLLIAPGRCSRVDTSGQPVADSGSIDSTYVPHAEWTIDEDFIAHAPADIIALVKEVEALRSESLTMRQWAEEAAAAENANARELREARAEVARLRALLGLE